MERMNWKKILLLCLPIVFAISLAITLAACMAQAGKGINDSPLDDSTTAATPPTDTPVINDQSNASKGLKYISRGDGSCILGGIGECSDSDIIVPKTSPEGDRVTTVATSAFMGCKTINTVILPTGIATIGDYAFYNSSIKSIEIPASTEKIGDCAFAGCTSLAAITINTENETYCSIDGVLFSKDKSVLICYPAGKPDESYTIRLSVGIINSAAFLNCTHLKSVSYNGDSKQWANVKIGANNGSLTSLKVSFLKADTK